MYLKKECVAMLLAGGQGSRLYALTEKTAKPAVPFGGKYRIIDFTMSNCINSGIDTVGVLTQYQPMELNEYIGSGQPWDLDRMNGGVKVLPPYQRSKSADWYKGTANAIYQNLAFIDRYDPDYVLVLSGDHIYRMDYADMLRQHKEKNADCTIAVLEVPLSEASRFGIMELDADMRIVDFEEKPKAPKSTKASMGIYIFSRRKLEKYLIADNENPSSSNDFGKDVIPAMLKAGERMFAYTFNGYWKDVGTLQSLWEANMDLLGEKPDFNIRTKERRIFSRNNAEPPHFIGDKASVHNSMVTEGCNIFGAVENSVLFNGVTVEYGAYVKDSVLMGGNVVRAGAEINYAIVDTDTEVGRGVVIGKDRAAGGKLTVVGGGLKLENGTDVPDGVIADKAYFKAKE